jgi:putative membrane protein
MLACVIGWRALFPGRKRPGYGFLFYILWLRASVNNLMPVARIGGEVVAVRVMMKHGLLRTTAVASTVVELTLSVIAVFIFNVVGIAMFTAYVGDRHVGLKLLAGLLIALPAIGAMILVQKIGFFGLLDKLFKGLFRERWSQFAGKISHLDRAVHTIYRRKARVLFCGLWQLISWSLGTVEIWLALHFLQHSLPWPQAFMIEALIQATSGAAFVVPGALGVQEAGFLLFGHMLGLTADIAVALAVIRRCRDLIIYLPGLICWQWQEGRWLLKHHANHKIEKS